MNTALLSRCSKIVCAIAVSTMALYGCASDGSSSSSSSSSSSGGTDAGSSSSGGSDGASSSGGSSSGGTDGGSSSSGSGSSSSSGAAGEVTAADVLGSLHKQVTYGKCEDFTNDKKGVTIRDLVVTSPRRYVSAKLDGIYAQTKGGGELSGVTVVGEPKGKIADLKVGQTITITGDTKAYFCGIQFDASLVSTGAATELPVANTVTIDKIGDGAGDSASQKWEGALIELHDVTVVDLVGDKKDFGNVFVGKDDKDKALIVSVIRDAGWDTKLAEYDWTAKKWTYGVKPGDKIKVLRGTIGYAFDHWRLFPTWVQK